MIRIWSGPYGYGLNIRQSLSLVQCEYGRTRPCGVYALFYILECGISVGKMGCASFYMVREYTHIVLCELYHPRMPTTCVCFF
jgi:hypothetical protein